MNLNQIYKKRDLWSHKGNFGSVLIVSGSGKYSGSPTFNAMAALRSGADLAVIVGHKRAMNIAASFSPDIITFPLNNELCPKYTHKILSMSKKFDSMIIGCGLERSEKSYEAIREILTKSDIPTVIDAEAIRALEKKKEILKNKEVIITPHIEEFRVLTEEKVKFDVDNRKKKVKKWAKKLKAVILLKGCIDIISDGNKVLLNKTGSPYMTKGGFGDTLSGICGALLARKTKLVDAAFFAARINGKAGELASKKYGESVLASDIFEFIPKVLKKK